MPVAEKDTSPKGLPYGAETALAAQEAATAPTPETAQSGSAAPPPTSPEVSPIQPPARPAPAKPELAPAEAEQPNIAGSFDLNQILFSPSKRPGEPVTAGLPGQPTRTRVADLLEKVQQQVPSDDVAFLAQVARRAGL